MIKRKIGQSKIQKRGVRKKQRRNKGKKISKRLKVIHGQKSRNSTKLPSWYLNIIKPRKTIRKH